MSDDTRYAYAVARIRGMETRLLSRQFVERLLSESAEGALAALSDTAYQDAFAEVSRPEDIESGLTAALADTLSTVSSVAPEPALVDLFRERWDFHNLRSLLKASLLKLEPAEIGTVAGPGLLELPVIEKAVQERDYSQLPEHMADAAREAEEAYRDDSDLSSIDRVIDAALWRRSLSVAREHENMFLVEYLETEIDLYNLKAFVRTKDTGGDRERLAGVLMRGGTLEASFFDALLDEPFDSLARALEYGRYGRVSEVLRDWSREKMPALESASDDFLLRLTEHSSTTAYGMEPLIRYVLVRELELKLVRTLVIAKLDGVDRTDVETRLRAIHA